MHSHTGKDEPKYHAILMGTWRHFETHANISAVRLRSIAALIGRHEKEHFVGLSFNVSGELDAQPMFTTVLIDKRHDVV